jgi:hypothetical protein
MWILIIVSVASPTFFPPILAKPPEVAGIPLGVVVEGVAMLWMLIGAAVVWDARSRFVESLAFTLFTIPATVVVIFTPAVVLIVQNLG